MAVLLPREEYTYSRLPTQTQHIRLLTINPAEKAEPLTGQFSVVSLDCNPPYEALSYVWGDPEKAEILYTPEGCIRITRSLHTALKRVPQYEPPDGDDRTEPRREMVEPPRCTPATVWADAVCINQEDNTEKAHQVRLMGKIYSSADLVWAYLGEGGDSSHDIFNYLCIAREAMEFNTSRMMPLGFIFSQPAVYNIFGRAFFSRVWIIQEFVLAKRGAFICGSFYGTFSLLIRSLNGIPMGFLQTAVNQAISLSQLRFEYNEERQRWPLVRLLSHFRGHACTQARDHFFALLSLADDASDPELDPNYDEPIEQTAKRYAEVYIKNGYVMELLSLAAHDPEPAGCLRSPSWIPDWISGLPAAVDCVGVNRDQCQNGIDKRSCKAVGNILQLDGRLVDEVFDLQNSWKPGIPPEIFRENTSLESYSEAAGSLFDDICRFSGIPPCSSRELNSTPPVYRDTMQRQGSVDSSTSPTARMDPGTTLMNLIQILPASANLERVRSSFGHRALDGELFAWLATCFAEYRSWRAHRVSIGLSTSLGFNQLSNEDDNGQEDAGDSSESDSDEEAQQAYDEHLKHLYIEEKKRFITWVKKKVKNSTKEEKFQFTKILQRSWVERMYLGNAECSLQSSSSPFLLLLHTFSVWKIFKTKSGNFGIVPLRTRIGDQLYITKVSKKPIVLRRVEGEEGLYRFVGVAEMPSMEFEDDDDRNEVLKIC